MRRFCDASGIRTVINNDVHKPLYDFNELLMKVNPKGIDCIMPMPIIRTFEQAVYEFQAVHDDKAEKFTWNLASKIRQKGGFFQERRKYEWILNYKEFEKIILIELNRT